MTDACRDWKKTSSHTWDKFKLNLETAHREFHIINDIIDDSLDHILPPESPIPDIHTQNSFISDETIASFTSQLSALTSQLETLSTNRTPLKPPTATAAKLPTRPTRKYQNNNYCWSHGFDVHGEHTSATCRYQNPGHQLDATQNDTKNGKL